MLSRDLGEEQLLYLPSEMVKGNSSLVFTNGDKTLCDQIYSSHVRGELDVEDFSLLMAVAFILSLFTFFFYIKNFITKKNATVRQFLSCQSL